MKILGRIEQFDIVELDAEIAMQYVDDILDVLKEIQPFYLTKTDIFAEEKDGRTYHKKWTHSVLLYDDIKLIGVLIAYERDPDGEYYTEPSLYIQHLAIKKGYQGRGIGTALVTWFIQKESAVFQNITLQTNSAEWNVRVRELYESLGFVKIGEKEYTHPVEKVDFIYQRKRI